MPPVIWTWWHSDSWHLTTFLLMMAARKTNVSGAVIFFTETNDSAPRLRRHHPPLFWWKHVLTEGQEWLRDKEGEADGRILSPLQMIFPIRSSSHYPWLLTLFQSWRIWWDVCLSKGEGLAEESPSSFKSSHLKQDVRGVRRFLRKNRGEKKPRSAAKNMKVWKSGGESLSFSTVG